MQTPPTQSIASLLHELQAPPPSPQASTFCRAGATHSPFAEQQPSGQLVASQATASQTPSSLQTSPSSQATQARPRAPQAAPTLPSRHCVPSQQPPHEMESHVTVGVAQLPEKHSSPASQVWHARPSRPQLLSFPSLLQTLPSQHPSQFVKLQVAGSSPASGRFVLASLEPTPASDAFESSPPQAPSPAAPKKKNSISSCLESFISPPGWWPASAASYLSDRRRHVVDEATSLTSSQVP